MHPDIWTVPGIGYHIRSYGLCIAIGIVLALWISVRRAQRVGADGSTVTSMALIGIAFGILGCRIMHYVHHGWSALKSGAIGIEQVVTATGGGEIVGGIVLAVASAIAYLALRRKPIGLYLDIVFPPMLLAMGIGRVGCFLFGCCWGGQCATGAGEAALPWAVRFPYGSPAYVRAWSDGKLEVPAALLWHPPRSEQPFPIPAEVLNHFDVDNQPELEAFVLAAERAQAAQKADPEGAEARKLKSEFELAGRTLGRKAAPAEVYAVLHLRDLRDKGTPHTWAELRTLAAGERSPWVHPAQLYDAIACALIFLVLSAIFYRRRRSGMVVAWGMILYGINRPLQEIIRGDNPRDTFGLTISQFMSLAILAGGIVLVVLLLRRDRPAPQAEG